MEMERYETELEFACRLLDAGWHEDASACRAEARRQQMLSDLRRACDVADVKSVIERLITGE